jgi:hypothetical protein
MENFRKQSPGEILFAHKNWQAEAADGNERVGAAGRGDCEDFADGFVEWFLAET